VSAELDVREATLDREQLERKVAEAYLTRFYSDPERVRRLQKQIEANRAIRAAGFDPLSKRMLRGFGHLRPVQLRAVLVPRSTRIHVPAVRMGERRPAGRRPRVGRRAQSPARRSDDPPELDLAVIPPAEFRRAVATWQAGA
jgi:hypothetical protein